MNTIDEMIEVLQAIKEGKTLEYKTFGDGSTWKESGTRYPNFAAGLYRVKKEQRRHWCVDYSSHFYGSKTTTTSVFKGLQSAEDFIRGTKDFATAGSYSDVSEPYEVVEVMK